MGLAPHPPNPPNPPTTKKYMFQTQLSLEMAGVSLALLSGITWIALSITSKTWTSLGLRTKWSRAHDLKATLLDILVMMVHLDSFVCLKHHHRHAATGSSLLKFKAEIRKKNETFRSLNLEAWYFSKTLHWSTRVWRLRTLQRPWLILSNLHHSHKKPL